jgi:hypothetical protein
VDNRDKRAIYGPDSRVDEADTTAGWRAVGRSTVMLTRPGNIGDPGVCATSVAPDYCGLVSPAVASFTSHTHTHTHTLSHTRTHCHIHTHTVTHTHTHTHTHSHARTHTHKRACTHAHTQARAHTHTHTHTTTHHSPIAVLSLNRANVSVRVCAFSFACICLLGLSIILWPHTHHTRVLHVNARPHAHAACAPRLRPRHSRQAG